jgi:hypothetical protein
MSSIRDRIAVVFDMNVMRVIEECVVVVRGASVNGSWSRIDWSEEPP